MFLKLQYFAHQDDVVQPAKFAKLCQYRRISHTAYRFIVFDPPTRSLIVFSLVFGHVNRTLLFSCLFSSAEE